MLLEARALGKSPLSHKHGCFLDPSMAAEMRELESVTDLSVISRLQGQVHNMCNMVSGAFLHLGQKKGGRSLSLSVVCSGSGSTQRGARPMLAQQYLTLYSQTTHTLILAGQGCE